MYAELIRQCSFGSLVLGISLRSPSDLLHRLNCHFDKQPVVWNLFFTRLRCWQQPSWWANQAITWLIQNPPISFQDNTALSLQCTLHSLIFSDCGDMQTAVSWNDTQTDKTTTICLWGSMLQSIMRPWKLQAQCLHRLETIQLWYNLAYA